MNIVMPWFIPLGIAIGWFGFETALMEKRMRGGRWKRDSILLATASWAPVAIWCLSCVFGD